MPEPHSRYAGETWVPLIIPSTHRYVFDVAVLISVITIMAFRSPSGCEFGLGDVILVANVILLWIYALS